MGLFTAGEVVSLPFPYSDLSKNKIRPAVLIAQVDHEDWIACQVTSTPYSDSAALKLDRDSFLDGGLHHVSYVRPGKLFTADEALILSRLGVLRPEILRRAQEMIVAIVTPNQHFI